MLLEPFLVRQNFDLFLNKLNISISLIIRTILHQSFGRTVGEDINQPTCFKLNSLYRLV